MANEQKNPHLMGFNIIPYLWLGGDKIGKQKVEKGTREETTSARL